MMTTPKSLSSLTLDISEPSKEYFSAWLAVPNAHVQEMALIQLKGHLSNRGP